MANPVFVDNVPPAKSNARAFLAYVVGTVATVRATDFQGSWVLYVRELDGWFERDGTDTTSPDNGVTVIVGPNGERWKTSTVQVGGVIVNAVGDTATRDDYDDEVPPFVYYDTEQELAFVKLSAASGDWATGFPIRGPAGPANVLTIGTVNEGPNAGASITGVAPNQVLNLVLPRAASNVLTIGAVVEGPADASITGTTPNQVLNLSLPPGPQGAGLEIDASGDTVGRAAYDDEPQGFTYLDTETGLFYIKQSGDTADWSAGVPLGGINGPDVSTDRAIARWEGTDGTRVRDTSTAVLSDNGDLTLGGDSLAASLMMTMNTEAGQERMQGAQSAGAWRWKWGASNDAETGDTGDPNLGSSWVLQAFDDAGAWLFNAMVVARNSGYASFRRVYDAGARVLSVVGGLTLTGGFAGTSTDGGDVTSGTYTPVFTSNNLHRYTNQGPHDFAAPSGEGTMIVLVTNGTESGVITPIGFTNEDGDGFDDTPGSIFKCYIDIVGGVASIAIKKVA